mmetsp:Transcript_5100/g.16661  ORF Transcript_5100/g.16661 Transcript_5100/m.16661 type:complete len:459 (+) Transcript_5100:941-2317(+)
MSRRDLLVAQFFKYHIVGPSTVYNVPQLCGGCGHDHGQVGPGGKFKRSDKSRKSFEKNLCVNPQWLADYFKKFGYVTQLSSSVQMGCYGQFDHYLDLKSELFPHSYGPHFNGERDSIEFHQSSENLKRHCLHGHPYSNYLLNYSQSFHENYHNIPRFEFTHLFANHEATQNGLALSDKELSHLLTSRYHEASKTKDTITLIIGDHGMRYGNAAYQSYGAYEHRLPAFFFIAPHSYVEGNAKVNIALNQQRLVTVWDVYETLKELPLPYLRVPKPPERSSEKGLSLQNEIPAERTCHDAGIPSVLCQCNQLSKTISLKNERFILSKILGKIRELAGDKVGLCHRLRPLYFKITKSEELGFTRSAAKAHSKVSKENRARLRVTIDSIEDPVVGSISKRLSFVAYMSTGGFVHSVGRVSVYNHEKCSSSADKHSVDIEFCVCKNGNRFVLPSRRRRNRRET